MITYDGAKKIGRVQYLLFKNENGACTEIPVDDKVYAQFMIYFDRLQPSKPELVQRQQEDNLEI